MADGRTLAAALVLGAEGIMMASRFMATKECQMHNKVKDELVKRQEFDTVLYGKTIELQGRALKNAWVKKVQEAEARKATLEELAPLLSGLKQQTVWNDGNTEDALMPVGQSIGLIHDVVSCKEVVERMVKEAEGILKGSTHRLEIK
jgi:nitronate monooxygenase